MTSKRLQRLRIQKTTKEDLTKDYKGSQIVQGTATTDDVNSSKGTKKEASTNSTKEDRYVANIKYPDSSAEKTEPVKVEKSSKRNSTQVKNVLTFHTSLAC